MALFSRWADWYDDLYQASGRDPADDVRAIESTLQSSPTVGPDVRHRLHHRQLRILDIGCGTGRHADALAALGPYTGIDPSPEMLAVARRTHARARFLEGTAAGAPRLFRPGHRFDVVVMLFGVAAYADSIVQAGAWLRSASSCLAPGGALFVGVEVTRETLQAAQPRSVVLRRGHAVLTRTSGAIASGSHLECTFQFLLQVGTAQECTCGERWTECHPHVLASHSEWSAAISDALAAESGSSSLPPRTGHLSVASGPWGEIVPIHVSRPPEHCLRSPEPCTPSQAVAPS